MLFKNEKIKNRNRKYYCGRPKDFDESKASLSGRYLFPSQEFAFPYAMRDGIMEEYKMKDTADIFDIHCKTDEGRLRKYCQENCPEKLKYIEDFRNKQFAEISRGSRYEDCKADRFQEDYFAKIIKELGYDGYFCIEADKNKDEAAKRFGRFYTRNKSNYSAIVIFNTDVVVKCNEYKMRDLADLDVEEYMVKNYAMEHLIENKHFSAAELIDGMKEQIFGLTDDEITDVFNSITDEDLENEKIRQINVTKALLKRAGCSEERIKEIIEKKQLEMNNKE